MSNFTKTRTIPTNFYGQRAYDILRAVSGQLSDGMWENSRGYEKYWTNFDVVRKPDDQVVFEVNAEPNTVWCKRYIANPFVGLTDAEFLAWYAGKLKAVIQAEAKDDGAAKGWWNRDNTKFESAYLSYDLDVTVADIYAVYDWLLGRKNRADDVYGDRVWGKPASKETIAKRAEITQHKKQVEEAHKAELAELDEKLKKLTAEIEAAKSKARDSYWDEVRKLNEEYKNA